MTRTPDQLLQLVHELRYMRARFLISDQWQHVIEAERVLTEIADETEASAAPARVPTSPGLWWMWNPSPTRLQWQLVEVLDGTFDAADAPHGRFVLPGCGLAMKCEPGYWIPATPPPPPQKGT